MEKNNLKGTAKLAMAGRFDVKSWITLKTALRGEFDREVSMMELHEKMMRRRLGKEESLLNYFYTMMGLGGQGLLSDHDIIKYIIESITDTPFNKAVLYGCGSLSQFKEKLRVYEEIRGDASRKY